MRKNDLKMSVWTKTSAARRPKSQNAHLKESDQEPILSPDRNYREVPLYSSKPNLDA